MIARRIIGNKAQIVLPYDARQIANIGIGTEVEVDATQDAIIIRKVKNQLTAVEAFCGGKKLKGKINVQDLKELYQQQHEEEYYEFIHRR